MKSCWTTLQVKDMNSSLHFYTEVAGLTLNRRMEPPRDGDRLPRFR